jgi:MFS family permease
MKGRVGDNVEQIAVNEAADDKSNDVYAPRDRRPPNPDSSESKEWGRKPPSEESLGRSIEGDIVKLPPRLSRRLGSPTVDKTWRKIILLWLTGVLAAAQLAKLSALAPLLRTLFGMSLPKAGLLVSLLEAGGATFGFVIGLALSRIGSRRSLLTGLALLAAASCMEAFASDTQSLFIARAVEAVGYLLVVIAAPTMIVSLASDMATRSKALALWSTFVPVGVAVGSGITGLAISVVSLRFVLLLWAVIIAVNLLAAIRLDELQVGRRSVAMPPPAVWLLAAGFGCYTLFLCALTALLPSFFVARYGASLSNASLIAGGISLAALPGAVIAVRVIVRQEASFSRILLVAGTALLFAAVMAPFVYRIGGLTLSGLLAGFIVVLSGISRTILFTRMPVLSGATVAGDPRIAAANGLLTQFGAAGALIGPPLGALAADRFGWSGLGLLISITMLTLLVLLVSAERSAMRRLGT